MKIKKPSRTKKTIIVEVNLENFDFIKRFSVTLDDDSMKQCCDLHDLQRLIKKLTCFKNYD